MSPNNVTERFTRRTALKTLGLGVVSASTLPAVTGQPVVQTATDDDWPMFQFDPANTGFHPDTTGPKKNVGVQWSRTLTPDEDGGFIVDNGPAIANETVYIGDSSWNFYALDQSSGDERWQIGTEASIDSTAAVVDGRVFFLTEGATFYSVDASTGDELWTFEFPISGTEFNSPTVVEGTVFFADGTDGTLFALGAETGEESWRFETAGASYSTPAVVNDTVYFGSQDGRLYALNKSTGEEVWSYKTEGEVASPTINDGLSTLALVKVYMLLALNPAQNSGNSLQMVL